MPSNLTTLLIIFVVLVVCLPENGVYAFGAGNIPSFAYMEGRAFRHGDIEDVLAEIAKKAGGGIVGAFVGNSKFGGLDIKRIYFGNWLRDYSQAVDIASLKKLPLQTIINLCMALGFLAHGYATHEFEVTEERLGVYLPTEHIDNPKGYGEGEDARKYNPNLRGPVDPRELEIDPRTGMKNYIANENGSWDTSKALVRRTLERCIHIGRQSRANGQKQDLYESYRLLGQALHTLEDFTAHSNFCELALVSMGYSEVFVQVGDRVRIQAPNGKYVAPLVTGTFGSSDFIHSLLGEATDHISEASVSDLNRELDKAHSRSRSGPSGPSDGGVSVRTIRDLLSRIPFGNSSDSGMSGSEMSRGLDDIERIRAGPTSGGKRPEDMSPQELHAVLWQVLTFRDSIVKKIEKTIERIPGLGPLIEKLMDSISVFVFTTLEPFLKPIMKAATDGLMSASGEVIDNHDQYEVFNDPSASDPTHSFLSKDHFNLILNEPAGKMAMVIVGHAAKAVVKAWSDNSVNVHQATEDILQCMFHPDFHNPNSQIQKEMMQFMQEWVKGLGDRRQSVLARLTKESVREHNNIRGKGDGSQSSAYGGPAWNAAQGAQHQLSSYMGAIPGISQAQALLNQASNQHSRPNQGYRDIHNHETGYRPPVGASAPPMSTSSSGEAASYYAGSSTGADYGGNHYATSSLTSASSYGAPPGLPPAFPPFPGSGPGGEALHEQHGYAPSYGAPSGPPPPSFGRSSFPDPDAPGGFAMPGAPPPFPSGGGPPMFPDAGAYAPPPGPPPFPAGGNYYSPPPEGYQRPPGAPGGW
ncbi:hypothetical protein EW145_g7769 [Phellinidium pouzarii]|uniref:Het-C-domain-containing protein n=1 Tax=Phellinidium pouzarii TaxID=167371 RepID=A0A4S4KIS2_9AGAM|nr:hypothetical protein EW145_g7769 [Phellinidium pouzarii]